MSDMWSVANTEEEVQDLINAYADQPKLDNQWVLNASIGKNFYLTRKLSLNVNLSVSNLLNNKNLVINAFQQSRVDTKRYNVNAYPTKLQYAQGTKVYLNVGVRF
jgi:hypothetical protein